MCGLLAMCQGCVDSCKEKAIKLKKQGRDEELTRLQRRSGSGPQANSQKVKYRQSPNDFSMKDTLSTLKFWQR